MTEPTPSPRLSVQGPLVDLCELSPGNIEDQPLLTLIDESRSELIVANVLRSLPGRRLVCAGLLDGEPVVVKWFFGNSAARYQRREREGIERLISAGLPTPAVVREFRFVTAHGSLSGSALVFEYLEAAQLLTDEHLESEPQLFPTLWGALAAMHSRGVVHNDLHFGNLMVDGIRLWFIDGDAVASASTGPLDATRSSLEFVRLAAQTRASFSAAALQLHWHDYCSKRQFSADAIAPERLVRSYRTARRDRIRHFQAKTCRHCSAFASRRSVLGQALLDREWLAGLGDEKLIGREMLAWLDALPRLMSERDHHAGELLKSGNTATVVAGRFRDQSLIIKRYNNKSIWHRLRRLLRPDRGLNSWVYAHTLQFTGIRTAPAVALLRTRFAGPSYLVMLRVPGAELDPETLDGSVDAEVFEHVSLELTSLMGALAAEGLVHRDTKASNFLWNDVERSLTLIDLDAMTMPKSSRAAIRGHRRDRARLLRNFAATPDLQRRLGSLLND